MKERHQPVIYSTSNRRVTNYKALRIEHRSDVRNLRGADHGCEFDIVDVGDGADGVIVDALAVIFSFNSLKLW